MSKTDKILVEVASYQDPDLLNTIRSAIIQADYPNRVFFSVCYQGDDLEDYHKLEKINNCKAIHLWESEVKGPCYARYLCQRLLEDEQYVFQIDSHMRFAKHWDSKMIEQLLALNDKKAMLSCYPPALTKEMKLKSFDDVAFSAPSANRTIVNYAKRFRGPDDDYFLKFDSVTIDATVSKEPFRGPFIAAGNFFSFAEAHREVLHDPEMYWCGDELPMSVRYYTHGWNNYCPSKCYVYHQYFRAERIVPQVNVSVGSKEKERLAQLLKIKDYGYNLGQYGLGKERTLKQFEEFAGIDFSKKLIYMNAENGLFFNKSLKGKVSLPQRCFSDQFLCIAKKDNIEVIIIDLSGEYESCVQSCLDNSQNRISFIIGTTQEKTSMGLHKEHIKSLIQFDKNAHYCEILTALIK